MKIQLKFWERTSKNLNKMLLLFSTICKFSIRAHKSFRRKEFKPIILKYDLISREWEIFLLQNLLQNKTKAIKSLYKILFRCDHFNIYAKLEIKSNHFKQKEIILHTENLGNKIKNIWISLFKSLKHKQITIKLICMICLVFE